MQYYAVSDYMLAYYSEDTTIPAYYDLVLGEKHSRDEDSNEMLELIFDNITYDPGAEGEIENFLKKIQSEE